MLTLSVGLFIVIPLTACIVYGLLTLLGYLALILSWTIGIIVASVIIGLITSATSGSSYISEDAGTGFGIVWLIIAGIVYYFSYQPLVSISNVLLRLTTTSWNNLMWLFEQSGIAYWSWIPISVMVLFGMISMAMLLIMRLLDRRPHWGKIRFICPHENCGHSAPSIVYKCPSCGEALEDLRPSRYGIFSAPCPYCGKSIRTSWLNGRNKNPKICPSCHKSLDYEGFGDVPEMVYIVEGASKSGKTSFLFQAMNLLNKHFDSFIRFSDSEQEYQVRLQAEQISQGRFVPPTPHQLCPKAYILHCKKTLGKFLAYFYDTGDNSLTAIEAGRAEPYFNLANGIFLVIDPWTESGIVKDAGKRKKSLPSAYVYAKQDANAVIGMLCNKLERIYPDTFNTGFDLPICVVVTKCDLNNLKTSIGCDSNRFTQSSEEWNEHSRMVEKYLLRCGMYNFVNVVKTRFKKSAFFAVSVLRDYNNNCDETLNPLLWMMYNAKERRLN